MRSLNFFVVAGLVLGACTDAPVAPEENTSSVLEIQSAPVVNDNLVRLITGPANWVVDANGNEVTDPEALLFFRDPFVPIDPIDNPIQPLLAPDGHQVTLGEYSAVEGRLRVKCVADGTLLVGHFSGLLPKGVYTLWLALFDQPIADAGLGGLFAVGAVGPQDGSRNSFRASASGQGQLSVMIEEGPLTFVPGEIEDGCLFDDPNIAEWAIVGAYHVDGMTHGGLPGPRVEQFLLSFVN